MVKDPCADGVDVLEIAKAQHDWWESSSLWPTPQPENAWIKQMKVQHGDIIDRSHLESFDFSTLNRKQHLVVAILKEHLDELRDPPAGGVKQLLALVRGTAGVGKSHTINALVRLCTLYLQPEEFELCAPTGCAACNVGGCTLHSAFQLPIRGAPTELTELKAGRLQGNCGGLRVLIVDEDSMVGRKMLGFLDARMHQGKQGRGVARDVPFGGVSVILVGDEGQLPPVLEKPKYVMDCYSDHYAQYEAGGNRLYLLFKTVVLLDEVVRQDPNDPFYQLLLRVRRGDIRREDWNTLCTRRLSNLPAHEQRMFASGTVQLFSVKQKAREYNESCLQNLGQPVAVCNAVHGGNESLARGLSPDLFGGLQQQLKLSVGALVMLRMNLWVNQKLVNGTIGTVVAILYSDPTVGPPHLPSGVVVHVPGYTGPAFHNEPGHILVTPVEFGHVYQGRQRVTRTQLPLVLAWGITIHKSQGMTIGPGHPLERVKIDFGGEEFCLGLVFVALSRATSLSDLAFDPMPDFQRLLSIAKSKMLAGRLAEMARIEELDAQTEREFRHLRDMVLP